MSEENHYVPEEKMGPKCICPPGAIEDSLEVDPQCPIHGVPRPKKRHPNCICLAGKSPSTDCPIHGEGRMGYQDGVGLLHRTPVTQIPEDQIQDLSPVEEERVNHPAHYGGAADLYEHIKVVDAWKLNYRLGNATKYICRAGRKPGADSLEDLRKALWYLQSEIDSRGQS